MRVLAVSNEPTHGADPDIRWALGRLRERGVVDDFSVFAFVPSVGEMGAQETSRQIAREAVGLDADVIVFYHTGDFALDGGVADELERTLPDTVWLYREADTYWRGSKPFPREAAKIVGRCAAAFAICGGYTTDALQRAGAGFVTIVPHGVNVDRFPHVWDAKGPFARDVVMIGNAVRSRRAPVPGARARRAAVKRLERRFGSRFAVFGRGWEGACAKGPHPFDDQPAVYAESRVAIGVEHGSAPFQFSDRLPIALACGIPTLYSQVEGRETVLPRLGPDDFFRGTDELVARVEALLEADEAELAAMSERNRAVAEGFAFDLGMEHMLAVASAIRAGQRPESIPNPWIGRTLR